MRVTRRFSHFPLPIIRRNALHHALVNLDDNCDPVPNMFGYDFKRHDNIRPEEFQTNGRLKTAYGRFAAATKTALYNLPGDYAAAFRDHPMGDAIQISPLPLILPKAELRMLSRATDQHMRALTEFFADVVLGEGRGIFPNGFMPCEVVVDLLARSAYGTLENLRDLWRGRSKNDILFFYGPDLMRDETGAWKMLEGNVGAVGGVADSHHIHQFMQRQLQRHFQLDAEVLNGRFGLQTLDTYFEKMFLTLRQQQKIQGEALVLLGNRSEMRRGYALAKGKVFDEHDLEYFREAQLLKRQGFQTITRVAALARRKKMPQFLFNPYGRGQEFWDFYFQRRGLQMLSGPGIETLLSSKLLLAYFDAMIRFYLDEDPILSPVTSYNIEFSGVLGHLDEWRAAYPGDGAPPIQSWRDPLAEHYILKDPDGSRGQEIENASTPNYFLLHGFQGVFGPDLQRPMVLQPRIPGSSLADGLVDLRPLGLAVGDGVNVVSELPWGRWTPNAFLTNVSKGAWELVVWADETKG